MFEKFGEMSSYKEINELAANLLQEGDIDSLKELAKENGIDFAVDIYPHYGSDVEATLKAGNDIRHGLIGPGVFASHGYERSHVDGVENTFRLIKAYLG